jgi:hypothetical protein
MHNLRDDSGFSVVEALVSLGLTVLVISGAIDVLTRSLSLVGTARVISETNHGLQAAMSMMSRDFMQVGQGVPLGGVPIPSGSPSEPVLRPGPTAGFTFPAGDVAWPALSPGNGDGPTLLGVDTDLVTLLYADQTINIGQFPLVAIAADGSSMTVNAATPVTGTNGLQAGDLILFSNALGNAVQMVTTTPTTQTVLFATDDDMKLNQRDAPEGTIMNLQTSPGVFPPTTATRLMMVSYYVDVTTDPDLPRLVRRVNMGPELAIALGVENLQITYDLVDGVTNPANVETPTGDNSANQIRKANLFLAARSQDPAPVTKEFFRNSLATQVGLRSLSFVDRYN